VLVWQDMPSPPAGTCISAADGDPAWRAKPSHNASTSEEKDHRGRCKLDVRGFAVELREVVSWLTFSVSVVLWVVFNEGWGQHATAEHVRAVRAIDSTRLVTDASGWFTSGWVGVPTSNATRNSSWLEMVTRKVGSDEVGYGDTVDVHAYPGPWPARRHRKHWYSGGAWEHLQWTRSAHRASVLGEFGGARLEVRGHVQGVHGWGYGNSSSRDCASFAAELIALWRRVANMTGLSACVYTQLTDVETEWNGLLTYDRLFKCDELMRHVAPEVLAARRTLS